ncbi:YybH family protein [Fulvimonas yonginensis]|uniref:DUF4440 domain-containing protein n=1 Tax=Fulvimonas yonginensis TaxID=1495200 RepID=A0ABU8JBX9_9GAMM
MKGPTFVVLLGLATLPASAQAVDRRCAVWQRELSFAHAVQVHDADAFGAHVEADAVFAANSPQPQRGRQAVLAHWRGLIAGKEVRLAWYPTQVVTGGADLALSSGPYLVEALQADARPRYTLGHFATVWHRGRDGVWRALFDSGDEGQPTNEAGAAAFRHGRQAACPASSGG